MPPKTTPDKAYCWSCSEQVPIKPMQIEHKDSIEVCAQCDNAMLFSDRENWVESERKRVERMIQCAQSKTDPDNPDSNYGHVFKEIPGPSTSEQCVHCGLPKGMTPKETVPEAIRADD
jgi:hypothetical protein